jgi:predicted dehydrogenase
MMANPIRIGVIGAGHWGPNLIRNFQDHPDTRVTMVCDRDKSRCELIAKRYDLEVVQEADRVLHNDAIDAVVIATSAASHYGLAKTALEQGKHILVEKPVTTRGREADELADIARERRKILMVGHVFLYNLAVQEVKKMIANGDFGRSYYLHARRLSLGPVREDVHAGWDLATHDVSIFLYLKEDVPVEVTASGQSFIRPGIPDVVFATLYFADGTVAHLHSSWLDPQKVRQLTVVGEQSMIVFDDMNLQEPIRIYQKGFQRMSTGTAATAGNLVDTLGQFRVHLTQGNVVIPNITTGEPLRNECQAFISSIKSGLQPYSDGKFGASVVQVLEAMDRSMKEGSRKVAVKE